jgi:GTP-binding protein Era
MVLGALIASFPLAYAAGRKIFLISQHGKIFLHLKDEIPYHTEVHVIDYEEKPDIDVIQAEIYVNRESHKSILIGKAGALIKKISTEARLDIEKFVNKKVFLEIRVKVKENWINNENTLRNFGY